MKEFKQANSAAVPSIQVMGSLAPAGKLTIATAQRTVLLSDVMRPRRSHYKGYLAEGASHVLQYAAEFAIAGRTPELPEAHVLWSIGVSRGGAIARHGGR